MFLINRGGDGGGGGDLNGEGSINIEEGLTPWKTPCILETNKLKYSDLNHVNNVIFTYIICCLILKCNMLLKK